MLRRIISATKNSYLIQVSLHVAFVHSFVNPLLFVVLHKGCRCIKKQSKLFKIIQFPRVFWNKLMIVPRRATIDLLCCNFSQYSARELPVTSNTDDRSFLVKLVQKSYICWMSPQQWGGIGAWVRVRKRVEPTREVGCWVWKKPHVGVSAVSIWSIKYKVYIKYVLSFF